MINGKKPGKTVRKLLKQLAPIQEEITMDLIEPNRLYNMAKAGDKNAKLLRSLVAQLLNKHTGTEWWSQKAALPEGIELLDQLEQWQSANPEMRTVLILSSPAGNGEEREECIAGKKEWLARYNISYPAIFQSDKAAHATPHSMLIDDQERKVVQWSIAGGHAVKFPGELAIPKHIHTIHVDMDGVLVSTTTAIYSLVVEAFTWHRNQRGNL